MEDQIDGMINAIGSNFPINESHPSAFSNCLILMDIDGWLTLRARAALEKLFWLATLVEYPEEMQI